MTHDDIDFPPGEPTGEEDPRQLLNQLWRTHDRTMNAPYGERYVMLAPLIERASKLPDKAWSSFQTLYGREHVRRRLPPGTSLEWMERAAAYRAGG